MFFVKIFSSKGLVSKVLRKVLQLHSKTTSNKHVDKAAVTSESKQVPRKARGTWPLTLEMVGRLSLMHPLWKGCLLFSQNNKQPWAWKTAPWVKACFAKLDDVTGIRVWDSPGRSRELLPTSYGLHIPPPHTKDTNITIDLITATS